MALKLLQPGTQPLGQFDGLDTQVLNLKGGEVVTFGSTVVPPGDKAAADAFDGYVWSSSRAVVQLATVGTQRPLMLADEGITGYGTLFGTVVGGTVGQTSYGPNSSVPASALLGPHTATGSGKVTCWDKPGLYAVSLDAVDPSTSAGLQPTYAIATGAAISFMNDSSGRLTPAASANAVGTPPTVGRFVEFVTNGSLVTTPNYLVAALNSPSGNVTSVGPKQFSFVVLAFTPPN